MVDYSKCVACGKPLMFTPITRQWVHIGGNAGISHYATPQSEDAKPSGKTWAVVPEGDGGKLTSRGLEKRPDADFDVATHRPLGPEGDANA